MIKRVDHIGIAVPKIEDAVAMYHEMLGLKLAHRTEHPEFGVKVAFLQAGDGSTEIELLEPWDETSTVQKFLERNGPGQHHVAYETDDIEAELQRMAAAGYQLIDKAPRHGSVGLVAFVHPKSAGGVLVELCQIIKPLPWRQGRASH